jgi:hypothetical protein
MNYAFDRRNDDVPPPIQLVHLQAALFPRACPVSTEQLLKDILRSGKVTAIANRSWLSREKFARHKVLTIPFTPTWLHMLRDSESGY